MNEHGTRNAYRRGCRCDSCRRANTVDSQIRKASKKRGPRPAVPLQPLLERAAGSLGVAVEELSDNMLCTACGVSEYTVKRWRSEGTVQDRHVDRVSVRLGWHPAAVWGPEWYIRSTLETN